jgi:hypothetical protein
MIVISISKVYRPTANSRSRIELTGEKQCKIYETRRMPSGEEALQRCVEW